MPSKSAKQHRFMEAVAHNPSFAKRAGVPSSVGKDFVAADAHKSPAGSKKHNPGYHGNLDAGKSAPTRVVTKHQTVTHAIPGETACNHGGFESMQTAPPSTRRT